MASTLSVEKKYTITLDNNRGSYELDAGTTVTNVGEVIRRDTKVEFAAESTLVLVGALRAAGQLTDIKFFVIKNNDDTNFITLSLKDTGGDTVYHKVLPGDSFDIYNTKLNVSETGVAFASFADIDTISAQADTGDVDVSIFAGEPC